MEDVSDNAQYFSVSEVILHPQYDFAASRFDIGLLRLQTNATITDYVRTVCIPSADMASEFPAGTMSTVSGWGSLSGTAGKSTRIYIQYIQVQNTPKFKVYPRYVRICLLRNFFTKLGKAIGGFSSETQEPKFKIWVYFE